MGHFRAYSSTKLPTKWGEFETTVYRDEQGVEHIAITLGLAEGELDPKSGTLVRIHSACFTSEVIGSLKCECREQLEYALKTIQSKGRGAVVYLFQEGRGIGLGAKIKAYALQEKGRDTVDANTDLGYAEDARTYEDAVAILRDLGIEKVRLLTNNPDKVDALVKAGFQQVSRASIEVGLNPLNRDYLLVKRDRMGHLFDELLKPNDEL